MILFLAILILPPIAGAIWLLGIRPYCIRNGRGYTPGFNIAATMWIDWQSAGETAKAKGDQGMITCCRAFLALHVLLAVSIVGSFFGL